MCILQFYHEGEILAPAYPVNSNEDSFRAAQLFDKRVSDILVQYTCTWNKTTLTLKTLELFVILRVVTQVKSLVACLS